MKKRIAGSHQTASIFYYPASAMHIEIVYETIFISACILPRLKRFLGEQKLIYCGVLELTAVYRPVCGIHHKPPYT